MITSKSGLLFGISIISSLLTAVVTFSNYLVANSLIKTKLKDALFYNPYVKYWAILTCFFIVSSVITLLLMIVFRPKYRVEHYDLSQPVSSGGSGPIEEYVTVRVKKEELSKLQS